MVKTSPSNAWGVDLIPGQGARIPHASRPKKKKRSSNHLDLLFIMLLSLDRLFPCVYIVSSSSGNSLQPFLQKSFLFF